MKRIIYKISGESLKDENNNISNDKLNRVGNSIKKLYDNNLEIIIVCGGGNLWRGRQCKTMNKVNADNIGMLATTMNSIALYDTLKNINLPVKLYNSFLIDGKVDVYNTDKCLTDLTNNNIVVLGGGAGLPLCTSDFTCIQRAIELDCDTVLLGKSVDGIYDKDPKFDNAKRYDKISSLDILKDQLNNGIDSLGVLDLTSVVLMSKYKLKALLFDVNDDMAIDKILNNVIVGTKIN